MVKTMKFDLIKASKRLSELELKVVCDNLFIDVVWFRAMVNRDEWIIKRHMHSSYEFHFITSGCCRVLYDDGEFFVNEGEFYVTAPFVYHEQSSINNEEFIEYCLNCDLKLIEDIPSEASHIISVLNKCSPKPVKDSNGAAKLFHKALNEAFNRRLGYYSNISSLTSMIVSAAARTIKGNSSVNYNIPVKSRRDEYRLTQITEFVNDNISCPITAEDISKYLFLSERQVSRLIKNCTGLSTKKFIMNAKLQKARKLLKESDIPIKQISEDLGFSSEYYFNQFFKREEGYPPGLFRKNTKNV